MKVIAVIVMAGSLTACAGRHYQACMSSTWGLHCSANLTKAQAQGLAKQELDNNPYATTYVVGPDGKHRDATTNTEVPEPPRKPEVVLPEKDMNPNHAI